MLDHFNALSPYINRGGDRRSNPSKEAHESQRVLDSPVLASWHHRPIVLPPRAHAHGTHRTYSRVLRYGRCQGVVGVHCDRNAHHVQRRGVRRGEEADGTGGSPHGRGSMPG